MDNAGLFDGMSDDDQVTILLDMLGPKVRVHPDVDLVADDARSALRIPSVPGMVRLYRQSPCLYKSPSNPFSMVSA